MSRKATYTAAWAADLAAYAAAAREGVYPDFDDAYAAVPNAVGPDRAAAARVIARDSYAAAGRYADDSAWSCAYAAALEAYILADAGVAAAAAKFAAESSYDANWSEAYDSFYWSSVGEDFLKQRED